MTIDHRTVALVTGSNRGLGAQFVQTLLERGAAKVYVAARSMGSRTGETADARIVPIELDITDPEQVERAMRLATDVNLLINNAGINRQTAFLDASQPNAAREEMEVNYFGTLRMARAFAPQLIASKGAMLNVLSILGRVSLPVMGSLCASKAAAMRLNECLVAALRPQGVKVLAILPGAIDTDMSRDFPGPKLAPKAVVVAALDALDGEDHEVVVGEMAQHLSDALAGTRAAVQQQLWQ